MGFCRKLICRGVRGGIDGPAAAFLWLLVSGLIGVAALGQAEPVQREVIHIRHFTAPGHTRIVLDMNGPGSYEVRRVRQPDRIAINVAGAVLPAGAVIEVGDGLVRRIRRNPGSGRAQVVIDLEQRAEFRSFSLPGGAGHFDRIVLDVLRSSPQGMPAVAGSGPIPPVAAPAFTVVIDPGHGGMDPGASRGGLAEKAVVMDIAREVARLLNALPGYRAVLTRTGDYGLELWERVDFAREQEGDLFLSIHCNTHADARVDGMEVYFLSLQGATDREARELADSENAAQLVGLDPRGHHDELVMDILMDLKMTQVLQESARLSHHMLDVGRASGVVGGRRVKQAGFQVLKSLAMPSALVEVAYMSNGDDMKVLRTRQGRKDLAGILVRGIASWRQDLPGLQQLAGNSDSPWNSRYQVRRGDSLWGLARRHGTTVTEISRHNDLRSGAINVGQTLRLPEVVQEP